MMTSLTTTLKKTVDNTCVVCLDHRAQIRFGGHKDYCNHACLCLACYWTIVQTTPSKMRFCFICNIERTHVSFVDGSKIGAPILATLITQNHMSQTFMTFLFKYLVMIKSPPFTIHKLGMLYKTLRKEYMAWNRPYITVAQCEALLELCISKRVFDLHASYKLRNALVTLCATPWRVDVKLGSHGVCHHGNMGYVPETPMAVIRLLGQNHDYISQNL